MEITPKIKMFHFALIVSATLLFCSCKDSSRTLFAKKSVTETGIDFSNTLIFSDELTVLEFEYMYNGAGVAVADFDLDGLQDIYFTANMSSNKLYRNLGDWKFEDITATSNTGSTGWSNGVAIVDINQDGYPDIYVSKGGPRGSSKEDRANLLFINNGTKGDGITFTESAAEWGLDDDSYSVQATFFDYDRDGDLDMYLLSNALVDFNRNTSRPIDRTGKAPSVDKLFRNNGNNTFTDVSAEAHILIEGFGLGVEVCDLNRDGWPDIYVSNDFLTDDILYINQHDGTFKNEIGNYFQHLSFNGMGNDISDINNDGFMDVVVLDMLPEDNKRWKLTMMGNNYDEFQTGLSYGYKPQYIRNTLQLNNGNDSFSEIGQIAGISATEWSWSALFADFDQDGYRDLCVTNGYRQDITNLDFMVYGNRILTMGTEEANRRERLKELDKLPGIKLPNYFYRNTKNLGFENISKEAGFTEDTYSNGMAYADLDNDGDLDLVINNIDDPAGIYENRSEKGPEKNYVRFNFIGPEKNRDGIGSHVEIRYKGLKQVEFNTPYRGYLSTVQKGMHFGLGATTVLDTVIVTWPDGKRQILKDLSAGQTYTLEYNDADRQPMLEEADPSIVRYFAPTDSLGLDFVHKEDAFVDFKVQPLLPHMHSRNGPGIAVGDINGDGLEDCFIGGAAGQTGTLMFQNENGQFSAQEFMDAEYEDMGALLFDADNDGDMDLYVVSGGSSFPADSPKYTDRLYVNDGAGTFSRSNALPKNNSSGSVVAAADYNRDGYIDLFVGGRVRPGEYPLMPKSTVLKNEGGRGRLEFSEDAANASLNELGMVTAALWTDFNNDQWPDLLVVGEFMGIRMFENHEGTLQEIVGQPDVKGTHGWWNSISAGDFDADGDMDYVLGNFGLNNRYNVNKEEPLCIYAKDYDKNGQIDPVMCHFINGKNYAVHSRNDLIKQINAMRGRFRTYTDYAEATFDQTFLKEELRDAYVVKCETFESSYLENLGNGKFKLTPLPMAAQIAPMYGTMVGDYNNDGHLDILAVGNFYSGEVFSGRYDASIGWFLAGDGNGNFNALESRDTGFFVKGDAKALVNIWSGSTELIMASINNGPSAILEHKSPKANIYYPKNNEVAALVQFADGKIQKFEFGNSSGYLSQPSRMLTIPKNALSVTILDNIGNEYKIAQLQ